MNDNSGKYWKTEDYVLLANLLKEGISIKNISKPIGRTEKSINIKIKDKAELLVSLGCSRDIIYPAKQEEVRVEFLIIELLNKHNVKPSNIDSLLHKVRDGFISGRTVTQFDIVVSTVKPGRYINELSGYLAGLGVSSDYKIIAVDLHYYCTRITLTEPISNEEVKNFIKLICIN